VVRRTSAQTPGVSRQCEISNDKAQRTPAVT
jgi:hypothetical protein